MTTSETAKLRGVSAFGVEKPTHPALILGTKAMTYGELLARARKLGVLLKKKSSGEHAPVASILPNGTEPFEVASACALLGVPYLPVNWHLKAKELSYLLKDAGVGCVVTHSECEEEVSRALDDAKMKQVLLVVDSPSYEAELNDYNGELDGAEYGPGPELVFYTSGTTSRPKGVVHGGLGNKAAREMGMEGQVALWGWGEKDVYVMSGPCYHAAHAGWGLSALYSGATTVMLDHFDAKDFLEAIEQHSGTRSFMVPAHFIRLLELDQDVRQSIDATSLKLVVHGGAPCPVTVKRNIMEAFPTTAFHELYGASEGGATRISPTEWIQKPGSVGKPWPGVTITIRDEEGNEQPTDTDGIIWITPPGAQRFTYKNDDQATENAWRENAFSVGDIGHLDADGYLTITDRVSDMVLWGGVNIAPREIEEVLFTYPDVVDCAVFGVPDERDGERLKAIVEIRKGAQVTADQLKLHLKNELADFKVPKFWEFVEQVPRDPNGKVLKRLLRGASQTK